MTYRNFYSDGDTFERNGRTYRMRIEHDAHHGAPWEENDGHGPVSGWTTRDKRPGEWLLASDRNWKRYYDAQEAMRIARRDGWGLSDDAKIELLARLAQPRIVRRVRKGEKPSIRQVGFVARRYEFRADQIETVTIPGRDPSKSLTAGEIAAEAVRRDFDYLRRWCNDEWSYVGVIVEHVESGNSESLWGIESDADEYIAETAHQLADEIARGLPPMPDGWDCLEFKIAGHYLSALINGDYSGLTTQECAEFNAWIRGATHGLPRGHWTTEIDDNGENFGTCEVSGLKAMRATVRYVYMIENEKAD